MKRIVELISEKPKYAWFLFIATLLITFILGVFLTSVMERRAESRLKFQIAKPIGEWEVDSEKWKDSFPRQFERWAQTSDKSFQSKYNGNGDIDSLAVYPEMVVMWAGYAFSREYNQAKGHAYAVKDIKENLRTGVPMPGTCWTCKSPDVPRMMKEMGVEKFYSSTWASLGQEITHPIGCLDCHDPKTMDLRVPRPALGEAFERMGKDLSKASHQEMRSMVCAQCHVEYYFKGDKEKYLTFPWDKGQSVEAMEAYYDEIGHVDWVHALSKAPMLKAQHPDWELFQFGIHSKRGLSCPDCHMPYRSEGGVKVTEHKIMSPLANINNTCQVCHGEKTESLVQDVYDRQDRIVSLRREAEKLIATAHIETQIALAKGVSMEDLASVHGLLRHAQWRWDYVVASVGGAFHAPLESARILGTSIQKAGEARRQLALILFKKGVDQDKISLPDISSKAKAQKYIGLNMEKIKKDKEEFLKNVISKW